jgi:hypothetical protein
MTNKNIVSAEDAFKKFDDFLFSDIPISIDDFLDRCPSEIKEDIRPLIELQKLLKDCSKRGGRSSFASLLPIEPKNKSGDIVTCNKYVFPYRTASSPLILEERSIIDEKVVPDINMESYHNITDMPIHKKERLIKYFLHSISKLFRKIK